METEQKKTNPFSLITPILFVFMIAMILANLGGGMYGSLESLYLERLGASVTQIGLFYTLAQIMPLLLQILGGWISDSLGRLKAIAIGSVFGTISQVILVLSQSWGVVLLSRVVGTGATSLVGPSFDAFIAENSEEHNRARVYGVVQTLYGLVSVIGPPIGGWIVGAFNFKTLLVISAILYFIATIIRLVMARRAAKPIADPTTGHTKLSWTGLKANLGGMFGLLFAGGVVTWILITDGVRDISFAMSFNFMSLYMEQIGQLNIQSIGIMTGIFGLFSMLFMIPGGWLSDKAGERVGIMIGFFLHFIAIGMIAILPPGSPAWLYGLSWALGGTGVGLVAPAYQSLISKSVPTRLRGMAFGLFSTSLGLVSLPAPYIGGLLWKNVSPQFPFAITAVVSLLALIPVWFKFKLPKGQAQPEAEGIDNTGNPVV